MTTSKTMVRTGAKLRHAAIALALLALPSISPAQTAGREDPAVVLQRAILVAVGRLPADSTQQVYAAQVALAIDGSVQSGTAAGSGTTVERDDVNCLIILRALDGAIASRVTVDARRAMVDLRNNLRGCNAGTGAGPGLIAGGNPSFSLPGVNVGGGSDYAQ